MIRAHEIRLVALLVMATARAGPLVAAEVPQLRAGAVEVGLSGSVTTVEGRSRSVVTGRDGTFGRAPAGLVGVEAEFSYSHLHSLERVDLWGHIFWQPGAGESPVYPYVALGGGLRQERLGSFSQARYPTGLSLGFRALVGSRVGFRAEYRFVRVRRDPIADFSERQLVAGISIFFRNAPDH